jgi:large subunit ribosomal protein L24
MARIKKNDLIQVITGKDKGKRGHVIEISSHGDRVRVKGVALQTHHVKARKSGEIASIKQEEAFVAISNVMPVCSSTDKPCRVNFKILDGGAKERVSNRSGETL